MNTLKILKTGIMAVILLLAFNCQKDDDRETSGIPQDFIAREMSLEQIPHFNNVSIALGKINEDLNPEPNSQDRTFDSDNVSIVTDDILYMTYGETHTYTFKILRDNPEYYIENIVLHYNVETNEYDEYLVQYDVSEQAFLDYSNGEPLPDDATVTMTTLENGTFSSISNRGFWMTTCVTFYFNCTAGGNHSYGETCQGEPDEQPGYIESCTSVYYDTNPTIDAGPSPGGGTPGGGIGNGYVITNPRGNEPCQTSSGLTGITGNDGCSTTLDAIERNNLLQVLSPLLNQEQANWINSIGNIEVIEALNDFIQSSSAQNTDENQDIALGIINYLIENGNSAEAAEFAQYASDLLNSTITVNPILVADCRSFEFAQPPGALQKGCAVTNFNHTFYTFGVRPNGSPYYGEIDSIIPIAYFTMPSGMTNGQAANLTAAAVTAAIKNTDLYFYNNPDITAIALGQYFKNSLSQSLSAVGGSMNTTSPPFPIPSPAPYITSVLGLSNPYDCD